VTRAEQRKQTRTLVPAARDVRADIELTKLVRDKICDSDLTYVQIGAASGTDPGMISKIARGIHGVGAYAAGRILAGLGYRLTMTAVPIHSPATQNTETLAARAVRRTP
jgi:hypothetical protein